MNSIAQLISDMVTAGVSPDIIGRVAEALADRPESKSVPEALEKRRAFDRARKAEKKRSGGIPVENAESNGGNNSTGIPPESTGKTAALARVEDNPSSLVITGNHTTLHSARAWPETDKPSRAELDALEAELRSAAGDALNVAAPRLMSLAPLLRLSRAGKGPPCDLEADVFPTIRARSAKAQPGSVSSWDFYVQAICEARDRRLSGAPEMGAVIPIRGPPQPTLADRIAAENAEARRLAFARMDAEHG